MKIIVDALGGDNAPLEIIKGCIDAVREYGTEIALVGSINALRACAKENSLSLDCFELIDASQTINMSDEPKLLLREKSDSSMAVGARALAEGRGDAFVSAGSTGALMYASTFIVKRIAGIKRIAIAALLPTLNGVCMLIDSGANAECHPEQLLQFAVMGNIYMKNIMHIPSPRIGLVNIGTEDSKGDSLRLEAFKLMKTGSFNFIGNVEAREIPNSGCDVAVTDGFTGNILLKTYEGTAGMVLSGFKKVFSANAASKLSYLLIKSGLRSFKESMSYSSHGGAPLLGANGVVIKAHGSSDATAVKNAVRQAISSVENNITGLIKSNTSQESGDNT